MINQPTILYGVGIPPGVTAYMAPDPPNETSPWNPEKLSPYAPYVPNPTPGFVFPTPDVFGDAMKTLQSLGLTATDSLRLIAIVNWECLRAVEIAKACRKDGIWDILLFAKELMKK